MAENGGIWKTFADYDRRYVYLVLFLVVTIPLLYPLGFPISVSPDTRQFYEVLNTVEEGDIVMVAYNTEFSGFNLPWSAIVKMTVTRPVPWSVTDTSYFNLSCSFVSPSPKPSAQARQAVKTMAANTIDGKRNCRTNTARLLFVRSVIHA